MPDDVTDHVDESTTLLVPRGRASREKNGVKAHLPDCVFIKDADNPREIQADQADREGFGPCSACILDDIGGDVRRENPCPRCGEPTKDVPSHVRNGCSPGGDGSAAQS